MASRRLLHAVIAVAVALGAAGCAGGSRPPSDAGAGRPDRYTVCPPLHAGTLPAGMILKDRRLPNLGEGLLGRIDRYGDETRSIAVHAGADPLDPLEDLDFLAEDLQSGLRRYTLNRSEVDPTLLVAAWVDAAGEPPCAELAVVARGFTAGELVPVLDAISLGRPEAERSTGVNANAR